MGAAFLTEGGIIFARMVHVAVQRNSEVFFRRALP